MYLALVTYSIQAQACLRHSGFCTVKALVPTTASESQVTYSTNLIQVCTLYANPMTMDPNPALPTASMGAKNTQWICTFLPFRSPEMIMAPMIYSAMQSDVVDSEVG